MKRGDAVLCSLVILLIGVGVLMGARAFQSPIPMRKLNGLKPGMTMAEVTRALGPPTTIFHPGGVIRSQGTNYWVGEEWNYTSPLVFGYVNVDFDTNGLFESYNYEEF